MNKIILAISLFLAACASIIAAPGDLDLTFGNGGIVTTPFSTVRDEISSIVVQPDGKILVSGYSWAYIPSDQEEVVTNCFIARYTSTGTLDASFGAGGKVFPLIFEPGGSIIFAGWRTVLQADGKIVTIGSRWNSNLPQNHQDFAVFRYNPNGTLDDSFGRGGKIYTDFQNTSDDARDVVLQPDGKIVVMGQDRSTSTSLLLARYNPDGSLDTTFGVNGKVRTFIGNNIHSLNSLLLQPDGKFVVAGIFNDSPFSSDDILLVRYNADGSLDTGFGTNGIVRHNAGGGEGANDAVLQPDGKIIVTGYGYLNGDGFYRTIIVRYNSNGTVDTNFAANGIFVTEPNFYAYNAITLQPNGKIISIGNAISGNSYSLAVLRLNANGWTDTSFGTNGTAFPPNVHMGAAVALQPDGKILGSGGTLPEPGVGDAAIVRFFGDSAAPNRTLYDFDGDRRADVSVFRPSDRVWYLNRSTQGFSATQFGLSSDKLTPADFDGDGRTDIAVFRDGTWYWLNSSNSSFNARQFGVPSDIPVPADFTGDGRAELAVFRPSDGIWYVYNLATDTYTGFQFGASGDKPLTGDFDGDGKADYAVFRPSNGIWYIQQSTNGFAAFQFGLGTDKPVPADYDGDWKTDVAVYRDGVWYLQQSNRGFTAFQFGVSTDTPAPADFDGDGKADAAVYRDGVWYLLKSTSGFTAESFGLADDKPIMAAYLP